MKRTIICCLVLSLLAVVSIGLAQNASPTPAGKHHKKKASSQATPAASATVQATLKATPKSTPKAKAKAESRSEPQAVTPADALNSIKIYDRINMPGDFRDTVSYAAMTLNPSSRRHGRTVFLGLERVSSNRNDQDRRSSYVRFDINEMEFGGPRNPWILLIGTVYEQKGGDCKVDSQIELAVDFKDIKIDYDGSKLGEIQKGTDIAAQVYEILNSHASYQLILEAKDQVNDRKYMDDTPAYTARAREGYAILDFLSSSRESSR